MPFVGCVQPCFRSRWSLTQRGVRSDGVVVDAPAFGQHTQLLDRVEEFSVEDLIPQLAVERFAVAVLPRRTGFDVQCFCASISEPFAQVLPVLVRCPSEGVPVFLASPSRRPEHRSPWPNSSAVPHGSAGTPGCARRSGSGGAHFCRHTSVCSRSRSSTHGSHAWA